MHEVEVLAAVTPGANVVHAINDTQLQNNYSTAVAGVMQGNSAIFRQAKRFSFSRAKMNNFLLAYLRVQVHLEPGYNDMNIVLTGDGATIFPAGVRVVDAGAVGYFPPAYLVTSGT